MLHLGQPLVQAPGPGLGRVAGGPDLLLGFLGAGQGGRRGLRRRVHRVRLPGIQAGQVVSGGCGLERSQVSGPAGHLAVEGRLGPGAEQRGAGQVGRGEPAGLRLAPGAFPGPPLVGQRGRQLVQRRRQGAIRVRGAAQGFLPLRHRRMPLGGPGQLELQLAQLGLRRVGLGLGRGQRRGGVLQFRRDPLLLRALAGDPGLEVADLRRGPLRLRHQVFHGAGRGGQAVHRAAVRHRGAGRHRGG